jgi:outer membrane protein OmpA-like peptidoglycan-associated protein
LAADGVLGDYWLNTSTNVLFGPKASSTWPATGTLLVGPQGPQGPQGPVGPKGATSIFGVISFTNASASLKASDIRALRNAGIKKDAIITVGGYTSKAGSAALNQRLSKQRADSIAKQIRSILPKVNVRTVGYGEKQNKACTKFQNRCVVISVTQPANN